MRAPAELSVELAAKLAHLTQWIAGHSDLAVAFSGGVDSSYLLSACIDGLGREHVLALTADSPLLPRVELQTARQVASLLGAQHRVIPFDDLANAEVASNPPLRCYFCKRKRFEALLQLASEAPGYVLVHGENADDHLDYRPGSRAAEELGVRAPLAEVGLNKAEIRQLSRARGLPTWDHPPAACLASRFPYNTPLTREGLARVEQAETLLRRFLPSQPLRLRDHYPVARIEVPAQSLPQLVTEPARTELTRELHALGYLYVTCDMDGYRMGSLNDEINT